MRDRATRALVGLLLVTAVSLSPTGAAHADTRTNLDQVRARVATIEKEAHRLAAEYERAYESSSRLDDLIAANRREIGDGRAKTKVLRARVRKQAIDGYVGT